MFKLGYEERFFDFMQDCIIEVERRIKRNKQRLDQNKDDESVVNPVIKTDIHPTSVEYFLIISFLENRYLNRLNRFFDIIV